MYDLEDVNDEIRKQKARERTRRWNKDNAERKKQQNKEWNSKHRVEYQKAWRKKNKK